MFDFDFLLHHGPKKAMLQNDWIWKRKNRE